MTSLKIGYLKIGFKAGKETIIIKKILRARTFTSNYGRFLEISFNIRKFGINNAIDEYFAMHPFNSLIPGRTKIKRGHMGSLRGVTYLKIVNNDIGLCIQEYKEYTERGITFTKSLTQMYSTVDIFIDFNILTKENLEKQQLVDMI